jgi:hypothetical protein
MIHNERRGMWHCVDKVQTVERANHLQHLGSGECNIVTDFKDVGWEGLVGINLALVRYK